MVLPVCTDLSQFQLLVHGIGKRGPSGDDTVVERSELIRRLRVEIHALEERLGKDNQLANILREQLHHTEHGTVDERCEQVFRRTAWDLTEHDVLEELMKVEPEGAKDVTDTIVGLGARLDQKYAEFRAVREFSERINKGYLLNDVMNNAFQYS